MTKITDYKERPLELLRKMPALYRSAAENGVTASALLEISDPTGDWAVERDGDGAKVDAFGRLCRAAGVVPKNKPAIGQRATIVGDLLDGTHTTPDGEELGQASGRSLLLTFSERRLRSAKYGESANTRAMFMADDEVVGTIQRPWDDQPTRRRRPAPQLPLNRLIAQETLIEGTSYRAAYVDNIQPADDYTYVRITEGAEFPTVKLRTRSTDLRLHKYGIAIDWTYEAEREMTLDKFGLTLEKIELSQENAKVQHVIAVILNGLAGQPSTASPVVNLSDYDPAVTGELDLRSWLQFKRSLPNIYSPDVILGDSAAITQLELMPIAIGTTAPFVALNAGQGLGTIAPINAGEGITTGFAYAATDAMPADRLLLLDTSSLIERVSQIGANVNEADSFITNQTRIMTFSEVENYTKLWDDASMLLALDA